MNGQTPTAFSDRVGECVCPVCGGKLIEDPQNGDRVHCDTCAYDTTDPTTWETGEEEQDADESV